MRKTSERSQRLDIGSLADLLEKRRIKQKEKADAKAKAKAESEARAKVKAEAEAKVKAEVDAKARAEEIARAKAEAEARAKAEEIARATAKAEAEAKAKAEAEARAKAEEIARAKAEAAAKAKAEEEAKAKEEARVRAEAAAKAKAEAEARAKAEAEARAKAEAEARVRAEAAAKAKAEAEARAKAEAEARAKAEAEAKAKAEAEARAKAEEIARAKAEAAAKAKAEEETKAKEEARVRAEAAAKAKAEAEAKAKAEAEARAKAEAEARAKAEAEARAKAEAEAKAKAEAEARARAEEIARATAKAEEIARTKAEAKAKAEAEARARAEAAAKAKSEASAEAKVRIESELQARRNRESQKLRLGSQLENHESKLRSNPTEDAGVDHSPPGLSLVSGNLYNINAEAEKPHKSEARDTSETGEIQDDENWSDGDSQYSGPIVNEKSRGSSTSEDEKFDKKQDNKVPNGRKELNRPSGEKQEELTTEREKLPLSPNSKDPQSPLSSEKLALDESPQDIDKQQLRSIEGLQSEGSPIEAKQAKRRKSFGQLFARKKVSSDASDVAKKKVRGKLSGAKPSFGGAMIRSTELRTGIDIGSNSIKLVHGRGKDRLEEVMICAQEELAPASNRSDEVELERRAVEAFNNLLERHDLNKRNMGRIVVSVSGRDASIREVEMAPLSEKDLQMALPFEAKTHLDIESMERPVLAAQILGEASALVENGVNLNRVLLVAVPTIAKNFPLRVLKNIGLEPRILDLDLLAGLNQLFANLPRDLDPTKAVGLVDIGQKQSSLHITSHSGGILSRKLGFGATSPKASEETVDRFIDSLKLKMAETVFFYRQRYSKDIEGIYLSGGGALLEGLPEKLQEGIKLPVQLLDPTEGLQLSEAAISQIAGNGPSYVNAMGLCRWGDAAHV